MTSPEILQNTAITAEHITTVLKRLQIRIEVIAGKMIRLDISREPIIFMPTVIVSAVRKAIIILYIPAFVPVAFAKLSSKVTANIF